ncbi:Protein-glutamate O-methyltransferase [Neolecta irregularis DAH-3]|uniref:Sugar phosphate phosphatase n=1 Tax=Neolecta irregularis (strain DAH-3) TaxID=1198029 RepID=A0A1U7LWE9_NEOID|nr:Protein-glutamate O-methyltransferase [Neolecta irregularis DAH-3]|eukprot:OLL27006.1 Protein-glutamate O-methyltransferase [Neolecta irregularis DAH-3]
MVILGMLSLSPSTLQKDEAFRSSYTAIEELVVRFQEFASDLETCKLDQEAQRLLFIEMVQISLFGNRTDLSLLTNLSAPDFALLQGKQAIKSSLENIISNHIDFVWVLISNLHDGRIDFVLDNSGFELFCDIIFALYLLEFGIAKEIVLHPKDIPWFVSDVTPNDLGPHLFEILQSYQTPEFEFLVRKLTNCYSKGTLIIRSNVFWTTGHSYWRLKDLEPELHKDLQESDLVIFKGGETSSSANI